MIFLLIDQYGEALDREFATREEAQAALDEIKVRRLYDPGRLFEIVESEPDNLSQ